MATGSEGIQRQHYQRLLRRLSDSALADLERRGFDVRDKSVREIKKLIALHRSERDHRVAARIAA